MKRPAFNGMNDLRDLQWARRRRTASAMARYQILNRVWAKRVTRR